MKGALPIHVDPNGRQVQPYFTGLHTLRVSKVGRHGEGGARKCFGVQIPGHIIGEIIRVHHIVEVARGTRIHRSRESTRTSCNWTMIPLHTKSVVIEGNQFCFWTDEFLKIYVEPTAILVFFGVHRLGFDAPSSFGIHITRDAQVNVVIEGKVIAEVSQAQSSNLLSTIGRENYPGRFLFRGIWNQAKRQSKWSRDAVKIQVEGPRNHLLAGNRLDFGGGNVPVRFG